MCGIYGRIRQGGAHEHRLRPEAAAQERVRAQRAIDALRHRGPEASGVWLRGGVTLAHARLRIIDLSERAGQPMENEDGAVVAVFNGEIYNFKELRRQLQGAGHRFRSDSDTEVLVHGYEQWGPGLLERLLGMFAFGIWDGRRRRLLLARDRAGQKPLFYAVTGGDTLAFASEIKGLLAAGVDRVPRTRSVVDYLVYGYVPPPHTFYENIYELPPAHFLWVSPENLPRRETLESIRQDEAVSSFSQDAKPQRYWKVSFEEKEAPERRPSFREAVSRVRAHVEQAVEDRLLADVPLGAFLSGGLDSAIVVGIAARKRSRDMKTFSIGFASDPRYDETRYARMAAEAFRVQHTEFKVVPQEMTLVEELVWAHDGPFADSSAIPTTLLAGLTREHVTVALTGDGGDEVFAGYDRFRAGVLSERLPAFLREKLARHLLPWLPNTDERTFWGRLRRFFSGLSAPLPERMLRWQPGFAAHIHQICRREVLKEALGEGFADPTGGAQIPPGLLGYAGEVFACTRGQSPLARLLAHNFNTYLPQDLQVKMDRCTMTHALEARSPFLDHRLVDYCSSLPDRFTMPGGISKAILRYAFKDLVPWPILTRGKMGFGVPLDTWFRAEWREALQDRLADPHAPLYDYLERRDVMRYIGEHEAMKAHWGHHLFNLLTLEIWLEGLTSPVPAAVDA